MENLAEIAFYRNIQLQIDLRANKKWKLLGVIKTWRNI